MCKKFSWNINKYGYVKTRINGKTYYLHRILLNAKDNEITDHENRNRLDNREGNLRLITRSGSNINRGIQRNNTSGTKGVSFHKLSGKWQAYINPESKVKINIGYFDTEDIAIRERIKAEEEYYKNILFK